MSVIKRRTAFRDSKTGRFLDWALSTTSIGSMAEPFTPNLTYAIGQPVTNVAIDEMNQIDEVRLIDSNRLSNFLGGKVDHFSIVGGDLTTKSFA